MHHLTCAPPIYVPFSFGNYITIAKSVKNTLYLFETNQLTGCRINVSTKFFCAEENHHTHYFGNTSITQRVKSHESYAKNLMFLCLQKANFTSYIVVKFCTSVSKTLFLRRETLLTAQRHEENLNLFQTEVLIILCPEK
jgi:hypothetical protein